MSKPKFGKLCMVLAPQALALATLILSGVSADAKTTITFFANARVGASNKDLMEMLVDNYNKRQNQVFVKYIPAGADWPDKILAQMVAGKAPDIIACWDQIMRSYIEAGLVADLSPYFSKSDLSDFYQNQLEVFSSKNKLYAVPFYMGISGLYYNVDAFNQAGVSLPTQNWSWNDMLLAAQKTTIGTGSEKTTRYGYGLYQDWSRMYLWILENGGKIFDKGQILGTKVYLDSPESIGAFNFQKDLLFKYKVSPGLVSPWETFVQGKVCTFQSGSWDLSYIMQNSKFKWDVAYRPAGPKGDKASTLTTDGFVLTKGSKHKREAVQFMKYLSSPESEEMMMNVTNLQPARKSLANKYFKDSIAAKQGHSMRPFIDAMAYASNTPMFLKSKRVNEILTPTLVKAVYTQNVDVAQSLKTLTAQINAISKTK